MSPPVSRTMLARLRCSARLAALVLLIFVAKIGAVAACAMHDFADLGLGTQSSQADSVKALIADGGDADPTQPLPSHPGYCQCSCHHAAAMMPDVQLAFAPLPQALAVLHSGLPPSASPSLELRPPIV